MTVSANVVPRPGSIPSAELRFHPHSFADDAGRLFRWNGQLYRGIRSKQAGFFAQLFRDGVVRSLIERGLLVDTELTDLSVDGYAMVVRHRSIPFVSYPNEWCATMLRDAALTLIDITLELRQQGLTLKDAHPWNILFDGAKPVWVDLTSIAHQSGNSGWPAYEEFCRFCYYPLILMSQGQERIARTLLPEYDGVRRAELVAVIRGSLPSRLILSKLLRRGFRVVQSMLQRNSWAPQTSLDLLKQIKRELQRIPLPSYESKHQVVRNECAAFLSSGCDLTPQQRNLRRILTELQPGTVLDFSRGESWSSILPAVMGFNVVSADADPARATTIYAAARENSLRILPLMIEFIKPTPSIGYSSHYSIAATDRLKSDLVLAFGLAQKIAFENHFNFDLIAEGLSSFSKRWLLVEFSHLGGGANKASYGGFETHALTEFMEALRKRFSKVEIVTPGAEPGVLILCER